MGVLGQEVNRYGYGRLPIRHACIHITRGQIAFSTESRVGQMTEEGRINWPESRINLVKV